MMASQRLGRLALVVAFGVGGTGLAVPAGAAEGDTAPAEDCVNTYLTRGRSVVVGPVYGIPYETVAGAPYVENELNSKPQSVGIASAAYEGFIGDVVIGTAVPGGLPSNPTTAKSIYPPAAESSNGPSYRESAQAAYGPFAQTSSKAEARKVVAKSEMFGEPVSPFGPSRALSVAEFDGQALVGREELVGYDFRFGPMTIKKLQSILTYSSDGTEAGTTVDWTLEFSGVGGDSDKVYTITQKGFTPQGGDPNGEDWVQQFNEGAKQFGDALETAGIGKGQATIAPAQIEVEAGRIRFTAAGLELRGFPKPQRDKLFHQMGMVFGYHDRYVDVQRGPCDGDVNALPPFEYDQPADKAVRIGPIVIPDPTPPSYGGPKSTTPVPVPVPVPAPARKLVRPVAELVARAWF